MATRSTTQGGGRSGARSLPAAQTVRYLEGEAIRAALLDGEAWRWAEKLQDVTNTQLRRFYDHVLNLRRRLEVETRDTGKDERERVWQRLRPEFLMLRAKAAYASQRPSNRLPEEALQFVMDHTASVKTAAEFEAFCKHFQAVLGFHRFRNVSKQ